MDDHLQTETCIYCSESIGDGELATRSSVGPICTIDSVRLREAFEASGLADLVDRDAIDQIVSDTLATFDTIRGQAIRRRTKRADEKGGA